MSRGPICAFTNRPWLATRGPTGQNDAGDPGCSSFAARLRGILGTGGPGNWIETGVSTLARALPGGVAFELVLRWVARNVDEQDMEAIKRIVRYVLDHPDSAYRNLKALSGGAFAEAKSGVSAGDLRGLSERAAMAGSQVLMGITAAGMVWGFLKSIYESIEGIVDIVGDLEGFIDDSLQLMEALVSPGGEEVCSEIGREVGRSGAGKVREIATENHLFAAFHLGELAGPVVVGLVLAYFTAGAGTAAMASSRFAGLLAKLRNIPKASKALSTLSKRMRRKRRGGLLREVSDAEIDQAIDAMTSPAFKGGKRKRIGGKSVPGSRPARLDADDLPRKSGETLADAIRRVRTVIGKKLADHPNVRDAWNRAARHVRTSKSLTRDNARELYDSARVQFWREIRDDPIAKQHFENAGFEFPGSRDSAPMLKGVRSQVPDSEVRISLDHLEEIRANWQRALDPDNLKLEFQMPNTFREIVQSRHPELR